MTDEKPKKSQKKVRIDGEYPVLHAKDSFGKCAKKLGKTILVF